MGMTAFTLNLSDDCLYFQKALGLKRANKARISKMCLLVIIFVP